MKEQALMRQIMGNVAHDMKTPLFSIRAELDSLKDIINTVCRQALGIPTNATHATTNTANVSAHESSNVGTSTSASASASTAMGLVDSDARASMAYLKTETTEKIDTILSLIYFIVMGINRSQDYAKLTTKKALKPALETVPLFEVLRMVSTCMSHQQNGRMLVVHPMVRYSTF